MTSTFEPTARPVWAVTAWVDDNAVYIELPVIDSPPYITKFPLTEGGLAKALGMLRDNYRRLKPARYSSTLAEHPKLQRRSPSPITQAQRESARLVLRKLGITRK